MPLGEGEVPPPPAGYFSRTRGLATSFLFILPLLLFYEVGLIVLGPEAYSAAAGVLKAPLFVLQHGAGLVFSLLLAAGFLTSVIWLGRRCELRPLSFFPMALESVIYAGLLGPLVWLILGHGVVGWKLRVGADGLLARVVAAAGAGVYEEILFRGALLGSLYYIGTRVMELKPLVSAMASLIIASCIFSLMHFVPGGEPITRDLFLFRLVAGLILSGVYLARGLGVACWTHALYNVLIQQVEA